MKTERLYAITIYLLNHGRTSAGRLAEHFEVSLRTIQRDIDSLCLAGIPVISVPGASGGYEIAERFRLSDQFATSDDYSCILTALQGLVSATGEQKAKHAFEKIAALSKAADNGILLDFSVLREGDTALLQALQSAIAQKRTVNFTYTNNNNETRSHSVEPIAVLYRWYAWYLLAYSKVRKDYRTYKLVRIRDLQITVMPFEKEHAAAEVILGESDQNDSRRYTEIWIRCREAAKGRVREYLKGIVTREYGDGSVLMKATVVENEQFWIGTLLSLGDLAEVVAPEGIRRRILESAQNLVALYSGSPWTAE